MDKELRMYANFYCFYSGTTVATLVKQGRDLVIGNVGDSRAVLGTRDENNSLIAVQLTVDLKPNLPTAEARIRKCKGCVFALRDEPEVARVWLPKNDFPGLAMARAFGDFCLKEFGLISVPDIFYRRITDADEFVVLAIDGIWDVLSNEVVEIVTMSAPSFEMVFTNSMVPQLHHHEFCPTRGVMAGCSWIESFSTSASQSRSDETTQARWPRKYLPR